MNKLSKLIIAILTITLTCTLAYLLAMITITRVNIELDDMRAEHKCIGVLVGQGVERADIQHANGICWTED